MIKPATQAERLTLIDRESAPGTWADAIAHSPCMRVEQDSLEQAIADVENGRAARICSPGKWSVWREGERVCSEVKS